MRLESFNVENLFTRACAMDGATLAYGKDALRAHADLNATLAKVTYDDADKARIIDLLRQLGIDKQDDAGKFASLRQNHGHLVKRSHGRVEVVANGRADWIGWVELKFEAVNEVATRNTARVIKESAPDVLAVIEAESRPALVEFSEHVLPAIGGDPFSHIMLIDGNDDRGIDVGVMTRAGYEIDRITSHVDDADAKGRIFSRDCAEYTIRTPRGGTLVVVINHLKSKGYGSAAESAEKRERQARRVQLAQTDLRDVTEHARFVSDGRPGTYANGSASEKIDYILLSPALFARVTAGGAFRKGVWGGKHGTLFPHFPEITRPNEAASDHAALWAELDL